MGRGPQLFFIEKRANEVCVGLHNIGLARVPTADGDSSDAAAASAGGLCVLERVRSCSVFRFQHSWAHAESLPLEIWSPWPHLD